MYKRSLISIILLLLLTLGCTKTTSIKIESQAPQEQIIKDIRSSTVALVLRSDDEIHAYCTAVWVDKNVLLTANHCVEGVLESWHEDHEEEPLPKAKTFHFYYVTEDEVTEVSKEPTATHLASFIKADKKHDLALLKAEGKLIPPHTVAKLANESPLVGEHVFVMGHPRGLYWSHTECVVSAYRNDVPTEELELHGPFVQLSGPVFFGNSGGGAFNRNGELIGIASFMYRAPQTTMFVSLDTLKTFIKG